MPSELSKLMRQYGVTSASMALPAQFKGTTVAKPTAPDEPVAPENTLGAKPVITNYDALNPKWTKLPTAANQKTVTGVKPHLLAVVRWHWVHLVNPCSQMHLLLCKTQ